MKSQHPNQPNQHTPSLNMKPNRPLGECKTCRPRLSPKQTARLSVTDHERGPRRQYYCTRCGADYDQKKGCNCKTSPSPVAVRITIPDNIPDTDQPRWNPDWTFLTLLAALITTIIHILTK